ncbi:hypothetical protein P9E76_03255 [Schinkia azotoformans]|uniref:hypothetical protein n=1 Tax=Schinkia azotoformans TaxID=1454 RepID=UPI000586ACEE|nr:hypothetical protein [Schinkia azotoformans]MEC1641021.1 hypothetical protein [Schinkia azotoformans]MEC1720118.1 hypothetical protein [Schinkia azotoformans]MEC1944088.1 hypothetical protein [Schinkia azotoformans]MED4354277.1 hypothetical protein [Schinkia azotoformans]MED4414167.1 hypothetical protein [Schinkia azotoformans]
MAGYLSPNFVIGSIKIGSIEGASCLNMGNNFPSNFSSHKKQNQGFGSIMGDHNDIRDILSRLDDSDVLDMYNQMDQDDPPEWIKEIVSAKKSRKDQ